MHTTHFEPKEPPFLSKAIQAKLEHFIRLMKERLPYVFGFTLLNGLTELASSDKLLTVLTEKDEVGSTLGHYATHDSVCLQTYLECLKTLAASDWLDNKAALLTVLTEKNEVGSTLGHYATHDSACLQTYLDWLTTLVTNRVLDNATLLAVLTEKNIRGETLGQCAACNPDRLKTYLDWLTTSVTNDTLDNATLLAVLTEKNGDGWTLGNRAACDSDRLQIYLDWLTTLVTNRVLDNATLLAVLTEKSGDGWTLGNHAACDSARLKTYLDWLTCGTLDKPTLLTVLTEKNGDGWTLGHYAPHDSARLQTYLDWLTTSVASGMLDNAALLAVLTEKDGHGRTLGHRAAGDKNCLPSYFGLLRALIVTCTDLENKALMSTETHGNIKNTHKDFQNFYKLFKAFLKAYQYFESIDLDKSAAIDNLDKDKKEQSNFKLFIHALSSGNVKVWSLSDMKKNFASGWFSWNTNEYKTCFDEITEDIWTQCFAYEGKTAKDVNEAIATYCSKRSNTPELERKLGNNEDTTTVLLAKHCFFAASGLPISVEGHSANIGSIKHGDAFTLTLHNNL